MENHEKYCPGRVIFFLIESSTSQTVILVNRIRTESVEIVLIRIRSLKTQMHVYFARNTTSYTRTKTDMTVIRQACHLCAAHFEFAE